jgi:hypothetical protein
MSRLIPALLVVQLLTVACHTNGARVDSSPFRAIRLSAGMHPMMPAIADVNNDNSLDILIANNRGGNVTVYLGDGKGAFAQPSDSPVAAGQEPNDLTTSDFNGDGKLDIALANHGAKFVTVLLGNGKGQFGFAPGSPFKVESQPHPHGIAVADFNGDQKPDIATDSWAENKVLLLFGKGDGTFQTPGTKIDVGQMPYQRLRTADLNADRNADLVTSNFEGASVSVLFGDANGNFARKDFPVPPDPFGVTIADVNGDGHMDIALAHYSGQGNDKSKNALSVLLGEGRGSFSLAKGSPYSTGHYPGAIATGDLNGDGIADIVLPNHQEGTLTIYLGGRNGLAPADYSPLRVGDTPQGVALADLNYDGKGDIVIARDDGNDILILLSK